MVNFLKKLFPGKRKKSKDPWASFEIVGFEKDGRIRVDFNWNDAFIKHIHGLGFQAETEEDSVQLFFYTSSMRPTEFDGAEEDPARSTGHPNLMSDTHSLRT